jgi:hypothetical protein
MSASGPRSSSPDVQRSESSSPSCGSGDVKTILALSLSLAVAGLLALAFGFLWLSERAEKMSLLQAGIRERGQPPTATTSSVRRLEEAAYGPPPPEDSLNLIEFSGLSLTARLERLRAS